MKQSTPSNEQNKAFINVMFCLARSKKTVQSLLFDELCDKETQILLTGILEDINNTLNEIEESHNGTSQPGQT